MIFEHNRNIDDDIIEVMEFIKPFHDNFYSSVEPLHVRTIFRGDDNVILQSSQSYKIFRFSVQGEGRTHDSYSIDFKDNIIVLNSWMSVNTSETIHLHSNHLNFPAMYKYNFIKNDQYTKFSYHDIDLHTSEMKDWLKFRSLDVDNWTEADYYSFCMEFGVGGFE